jgi:metal-responsive CopG/Arc/MetJ family transcriptional regulator
MQMRRFLVTLPPELYAELEKRAREEDRDAIQQARVILRRALEAPVSAVKEARK